jgi:putative hydrolase of the HAD superfamily
MRFDAAAFDLDGTLYPAARLYALAFPRMLGKARGFMAFNAARRELRTLGDDKAYRRSPPADGRAFHARVAEIAAAHLGLGLAETAALIERDFYNGIEELFSKLRPFRGLEAALDRIQAGGLRLAVLSDLPPHRKLELLGMGGRFELALCSEDSGFLKPAREPFEMLASRLGLEPQRILYVGNSPAIDAAGAKAAGMSAAIISRRHVKGADLSFFDWNRLADFVLG